MESGKNSGFTLLEFLMGAFILALILGGAVKMKHTFSKTNALSRDHSDGTNRLNRFIDSIRGEDPASLTRNTENMLIGVSDTLRWKLFDNTSGAPYTQPTGIMLLAAKYSWKKENRMHYSESATLMISQ